MIELNVQSVKEFSYSPFRSLLQKEEIFRESIIYVFDRFESLKVFTFLFCERNFMEFQFSFATTTKPSIVVIDAKDREFPVSRREKFSKFLP